MSLISELRRRNVLRMAVLYVVAAWLVLQVAEVIVGLANLPEWIGPAVLGLLAVGFPIALIFSWFYELTPEGISLEKDIRQGESITSLTGRRMDFIVISLLCAAVLLFAYDKWWIGPPPEKSIAVLPFENMSADPEQDYFSDGISEELLNVLAKLPGLRVAARTSSFQFKGQLDDVAEIAAQLNVAHILEGSVRRSGNRLRVTAQLIKADDGFHLWSETYDRELDDVFAMQDEIAAAISEALRVELALVDGEAAPPTVIRADNLTAYDAYLKGRELIHLGGRDNSEAAVRYLERSLRLDERFAPAHAQLAIARMALTGYVASPREEARRVGIAHLDRAEELEPDLAEAHLGRAIFAHYADDPEGTIEHARKALTSNPNLVEAMSWLHEALSLLGRYEEANVVLENMLVTDPLSITTRFHYAGWLRARGRLEEAHGVADQLLTQDLSQAAWLHADIYFSEGRLAECLSWALRAPTGLYYSRWAFALVGEYDEARRSNGMHVYWVDVAEGRWDEAIRATQNNMKLYPENGAYVVIAAEALFLAGRVDEALPLYERALEFVPEGRPLPRPAPHFQTMALAHARRAAGDETGARAAVQIVKDDLALLRAAGADTRGHTDVEAMIAAFEHDTERAIGLIRAALQRGLRYPFFLDSPIFEDLRDEPEFIALRNELDALLDAEHARILQLVCFNNPAPERWQPMPETCEGVARHGL